MKFFIRQVAKPEGPAVLQVRSMLVWMDAVCFPEDDPFEKWGSAWWWVAVTVDRSAPAGFAGLSRLYDDRGYLCRAGVMPAFRGQRLQRRLIRVRELAARKMGLKRLVTDTLTSNPASNNTLIACGYRTYVPEEYVRDAALLYWFKDL